MRIAASSFVALILVTSNIAAAAGKYDREKICPRPNDISECDLLVEKAVASQIPGVVERRGAVLYIHAKNGKTLERKDSGPKVKETESWKRWVCNYFPANGYLEVCYRLWESSKSEFVNINSGSSISIDGWPVYSPLGHRVLMVNGYGGEVYSLEVWRFDEKGPLKEFRIESPPGAGEMWEMPIWKSENEILPDLSSSASPLKYRLVRERNSWRLDDK